VNVNKLSLLALLALPVAVRAQTQTSPPPATPPAATPGFDFSGVLFANFQYRTDEGTAKGHNKFDVERVYLTFKMPAGERGSIRVTGDVFQQTTSGSDSYYKGWTLRAKYAYFQYDFLKSASWNALARAGILHTVVIDHQEGFWPRFITNTAIERAGFFSSADAGVATQVALPNKLGEFYATITNGPGYTSRETDRFKDYAARLSLTPFKSSDNRLARALTLSGWGYRGAVGSKFASGGAGQVGTVGSGLDRNRAGVFLALRDPRFTIGAEYATRTDGSEGGANTVASPRTVTDSTGRLIDWYIVLRPFNFSNLKGRSPLGIVARMDRFKPNTNTAAYSNFIVGGLVYDLNARSSVSLDYQEQTPHSGLTVTANKTVFLHLVANF
jgi:hypothetical protein